MREKEKEKEREGEREKEKEKERKKEKGELKHIQQLLSQPFSTRTMVRRVVGLVVGHVVMVRGVVRGVVKCVVVVRVWSGRAVGGVVGGLVDVFHQPGGDDRGRLLTFRERLIFISAEAKLINKIMHTLGIHFVCIRLSVLVSYVIIEGSRGGWIFLKILALGKDFCSCNCFDRRED